MSDFNVPDGTLTPLPQESALLKCDRCGQARRVWLKQCERCGDPVANWYEQRIAFLEEKIRQQDALIRKQVDLLHSLEKQR